MSKNILIIGFGIDKNRIEAVSQNTVKHISLLKNLGFKVYLYNIGYKNQYSNTGNGFFSSLLNQKSIAQNLIRFINEKKITHILDVFVLPLSSTIFTLPLQKFFPRISFIKEIHNDHGFSKKIHSETLIRIIANNKVIFNFINKRFNKVFTKNLHLSKKYSIQYIPTEIHRFNQKKHNNKKINICYLGHPLKKKGIKKLLDLFPLLDEKSKRTIKFNFAFSNVGPRKKVEKEFLKTAKKFDVNVSFFGKVKPHEFFRNNDIYVLPIEDEYGAISTPNTILEAMEAKCLVIANNIKSLSGIAENKKNILLLKENSSKNILLKIKQIMNDKSLQKKIINNASSFIKNNYSSKIIKEKVKKLYA